MSEHALAATWRRIIKGEGKSWVAFVGPGEVAGDDDLTLGLFGRGKRDRDGHDLEVVHVEDKRSDGR